MRDVIRRFKYTISLSALYLILTAWLFAYHAWYWGVIWLIWVPSYVVARGMARERRFRVKP